MGLRPLRETPLAFLGMLALLAAGCQGTAAVRDLGAVRISIANVTAKPLAFGELPLAQRLKALAGGAEAVLARLRVERSWLVDASTYGDRLSARLYSALRFGPLVTFPERLLALIFSPLTASLDGGQGVGTGIRLGDGYVLTAAHVTTNAQVIHVDAAGETRPARVLATYPEQDLALLKISSAFPGTRPPKAAASLAVGEPLVALGYAGGDWADMHPQPSLTFGVTSALGSQVGGSHPRSLVQFDALVRPGMSGGPLFDLAGRWVGVVHARRRGSRGESYAISIDTILEIFSGHELPQGGATGSPAGKGGARIKRSPPIRGGDGTD